MQDIQKSLWKIWAKKHNDPPQLIPLMIHAADCMDVAERLWDNWLSDGAKIQLAQRVGDMQMAKNLLLFFAGIHDIGKATPVFQSKHSFPAKALINETLEERLRASGLDLPEIKQSDAKETPHAFAGEVILRLNDCHKSIACVIGSHHGTPSDFKGFNPKDFYNAYIEHYIGREDDKNSAWEKVREAFISHILSLSGFTALKDLPEITLPTQVQYSGLLIMTDWLASNTLYYPMFDLNVSVEDINLEERHQKAWESFNLPYGWRQQENILLSELCENRFGFKPNILQETVLQSVKEMSGGMMVIEAPMGMGKTEAALLAAELLMQKQGRSGVFFALPTQAVSDGMFPRFEKWISRLDDEQHNLQLSHGKAQFNDEYMKLANWGNSKDVNLYEESNQPVVHTWFSGSKKALLADFVVGTIDQLLMAALNQRHVMLRHVGLVNKVVIIDECHAYDAYMNHYLHRVLHWLGAYNVPVIILSATLPKERRKMLIGQYLGLNKGKSFDLCEPWTQCEDYPLITWVSNGCVKQIKIDLGADKKKTVSIRSIEKEALPDMLSSWQKGGGCVGIIVNTVAQAQELFDLLNERFAGVITVIHAALLTPVRMERERRLREMLGKEGNRPHFHVVIGTQVLEQSLDIDFDVMITQLCPMDLLLQRIGRLHRHNRNRPKNMEKPVCYVMNLEIPDGGSKAVYGEFLLERTKAFLKESIELPKDIAPLVQRVYAADEDLPCPPKDYEKKKKNFFEKISGKEIMANTFRVGDIDSAKFINGWLKFGNVNLGEAQVRDSRPTVEVLVVQKTAKGIRLLDDGSILSPDAVPSDKLAKRIARQSLRLPSRLFIGNEIEYGITCLERQTLKYLKNWQESPWLKDELFLILDEQRKAKLNGFILTYDDDKGLIAGKEKEEAK